MDKVDSKHRGGGIIISGRSRGQGGGIGWKPEKPNLDRLVNPNSNPIEKNWGTHCSIFS